MRRFLRAIGPIATLLLSSLGAAARVDAATLKVSSFPSGAQVLVDGVDTGKVTPMNVSVSEGDHTVTVRFPGSGWNPDTRTVTIGAGNNDLSVTLLPIMTAGPAGPPGPAGAIGATGATGPQGPQGAPGINGIDGIDGTNGTNGSNGTNGVDGTSVTFVDYFSGNANGCPNGGAIYSSGNPRTSTYVCNGTNGQDGQDGTNVARADGPCSDNTNRYVDCGNGTVTDTVTGLIWLKQAGCFPGRRLTGWRRLVRNRGFGGRAPPMGSARRTPGSRFSGAPPSAPARSPSVAGRGRCEAAGASGFEFVGARRFITGGRAPVALLDPKRCALGELRACLAADDYFRRGLDIDPLFGPAYINLAIHLRETNRPDESVRVCDRGLAMMPNYLSLKRVRAISLLRLNRVDEAEEALQALLRDQEPNRADMNAMAHLYILRGRMDLSERIPPGNAWELLQRAHALATRGETDSRGGPGRPVVQE